MDIAVIEGDGVGPEVVGESLKVLKAIGEKYGLEYSVTKIPIGADHFLETGTAFPSEIIEDLKMNYSAVLFGTVGDPRIKSNEYMIQMNSMLKQKLDLHINFRPVKLMDQSCCPLKGVKEEHINFTFFSEEAEGVSPESGVVLKKDLGDEIALENCIYTRVGAERIIRAAFEYADHNGMQKVTMCDNGNVMKVAADLWQRIFDQIGREYPHIERENVLIQSLSVELIKNPERFQVIVINGLFSTIVSDMASQLQGGLGLGISANINQESGLKGLYKPLHGSEVEITGKRIANPMASILSLALLLEHQGYINEAFDIRNAVKQTLKKHVVTPDLYGTYSSKQVGKEIRKTIANCDHICIQK